ncbi:MAG: acyl carrier protein [Alphaproteobacteria bacterium]|nr:acyl carrier protein [Alphaproteobacteria bacterium]
MYTKDEIFQNIKEILVKEFDVNADELKPESLLVEDLDLDSIDAVDLVVRLQKIIGCKVEPDDFKQIRTLQDMVDAIEKIVNKNH